MFDIDCRRCPRLAAFLEDVSAKYPDYHARPVASFGPKYIDVLIVGLAPGMHGANATGRPFTGDQSGALLYQTLFDTGFSNKPVSARVGDGLTLKRCRITNAVKCLPPQNRPTTAEIKTCNVFLQEELATLKPGTVIVALGAIAHRSVLQATGLKPGGYPFGHGHQHVLPGKLWLLDSYHCSRYNTQTKRLTPTMFQQVFIDARALIGTIPPSA